MSLATRCIACGTVFRVVQDQLKVSEGWVRCGRCQEVFNALQNLFDLERETPPAWPPEPGVTLVDWAASPQPVEAEFIPIDDHPDHSDHDDSARLSTQPLLHRASRDDDADEELPIEPSSSSSSSSYGWLAERDHVTAPPPPSYHPSIDLDPRPWGEPALESSGFGDARFPSDLLDSAHGGAESTALAALHSSGDPAPQFLRQADRAARWRQPRVRAALGGALALAIVLLAAQAAFQWRSMLAARWPESRPSLETLCALAACRIEPPRRLDSLVVENSSLVNLGAPGQSRLTVSLHNRSQTLAMLPFVELTLTNSQGQLVARKALAPTDMGAKQTSIAAGAELPLQALLATSDIRDGGYTVEIFYP